jgi:hypothetical protein
MFGSILRWFLSETKAYGNRLKEIEEEMQAEHEREQRQPKKEASVEILPRKNNSRYNCGKD